MPRGLAALELPAGPQPNHLTAQWQTGSTDGAPQTSVSAAADPGRLIVDMPRDRYATLDDKVDWPMAVRAVSAVPRITRR